MIIKGGRLIDPVYNIDEVVDLLIKGGKVTAIGKSEKWDSQRVIEATGKWVLPGLIDMHVHLRDPGFEYKETIKTGSKSAAAGGFTSIACMANTKPVNDNRAITEYILRKAVNEAVVNIFVIASVTKELAGKELSEMADLQNAGAVGFSDDGKGIMSSEVMRRALEYASMLDVPIISHAEDSLLAAHGVMNEGAISTELGLKGIPCEAETVMAGRDIALAELTGTKLHIAHVSAAGTVDLVRAAKKRGTLVTCETAPHYFTLTDESVRGFDPNTKMNPPLRTNKDKKAIIKGLQDGTIDVIATDHAPHDRSEKEDLFTYSPFGIVGLETSLPLVMELINEGVLTPTDAFQKMTSNPAQILNIRKGSLGVGDDADVTIVDPEAQWTVNRERFCSKGRNTPFHGRKVQGLVTHTIVSGKTVYKKTQAES